MYLPCLFQGKIKEMGRRLVAMRHAHVAMMLVQTIPDGSEFNDMRRITNMDMGRFHFMLVLLEKS